MSQNGEAEEGYVNNTYNISHRAFLQAFLSSSTLTFAAAKPILAAIQSAHLNREILDEDITEAEFTSYIHAINNAISPYDYEIRDTLPQVTKSADGHQPSQTRLYALVNTTSDGITQLATVHTAAEIAFVKRVLDGMFETYNTRSREIMAINSMQALQLAKPPPQSHQSSTRASSVTLDGVETQARTNGGNAAAAPGAAQALSKTEAEKVLRAMVDEGWFVKQRDYYSLSPRGLMELRGWLLDTYNEPDDEDGVEPGGVERIKLCYGCRDIVTVGQRCSDKNCKARFHDPCTRTMGREPKCPVCGTAWTGRDYVGPRAAS